MFGCVCLRVSQLLMFWLLQVLNQSTSIDGLKKSESYPGSLLEHFYAVYGSKDTAEFKAAQRRFACSLAGYSVISYLLGIKDRHNGNVMVDSDGHIVHIDFGFVLGSAPGGAVRFEYMYLPLFRFFFCCQLRVALYR